MIKLGDTLYEPLLKKCTKMYQKDHFLYHLSCYKFSVYCVFVAHVVLIISMTTWTNLMMLKKTRLTIVPIHEASRSACLCCFPLVLFEVILHLCSERGN